MTSFALFGKVIETAKCLIDRRVLLGSRLRRNMEWRGGRRKIKSVHERKREADLLERSIAKT